jgi:hypothetical protein
MSDQAPDTIDGQGAAFDLPPVEPVAVPPAADAKPRRTRRAAAPKDDKPPRTPRAKKAPALAPRLTTAMVTIGTLVGLVDQFDGLAICQGAPAFADALAEAAEENPKLKAALERALTIGTMGKVTTAGAAIALPIAAHHGLIPKALMNLFGGAAPAEGESAPAAA